MMQIFASWIFKSFSLHQQQTFYWLFQHRRMYTQIPFEGEQVQTKTTVKLTANLLENQKLI